MQVLFQDSISVVSWPCQNGMGWKRHMTTSRRWGKASKRRKSRSRKVTARFAVSPACSCRLPCTPRTYCMYSGQRQLETCPGLSFSLFALETWVCVYFEEWSIEVVHSLLISHFWFSLWNRISWCIITSFLTSYNISTRVRCGVIPPNLRNELMMHQLIYDGVAPQTKHWSY
jgi:hypothetical protein